MIKVKSGLLGDKVALWERHPDHPGGEVFIAGEGEHEVAETPQVQARLKRGVLIEVKAEQIIAKLTDIKGIGQATARKLTEAGINDLAHLLAVDTVMLAETLGIDIDQMMEWKIQAEALLSGDSE